MKLQFRHKHYDEMFASYRQLLQYLRVNAVSPNATEKGIASILEYVSKTDRPQLLHEFYAATLEALGYSKNEVHMHIPVALIVCKEIIFQNKTKTSESVISITRLHSSCTCTRLLLLLLVFFICDRYYVNYRVYVQRKKTRLMSDAKLSCWKYMLWKFRCILKQKTIECLLKHTRKRFR